MLPIIIAFSLLLLTLILLFDKKKDKQFIEKTETPDIQGKPCPICGWLLLPKQRVHSVLYTSNSDSIMHIFGCPFCYKDHPVSNFNKNLTRKCPSCKKNLGENEYVIARLFEKPGKNHVHVLGCYRCRGKK
jgi:hypothetical protein